MARIRTAFPLSQSQRLSLLAAIIVLAALVILDFFVDHHGAFGIDGTPGFAAWFGFAAAVLAIALSIGWASLAAAKSRGRDD
jgi:hypothetical protein